MDYGGMQMATDISHVPLRRDTDQKMPPSERRISEEQLNCTGH